MDENEVDEIEEENPYDEDSVIVLSAGDWAAQIAPYGASLRGATFHGETVVTGYVGAKNKLGGQGDVLIPFPGRVGGGTYKFDGKKHRMPQNDKDGPNAIHGFVRFQLWDVIDLRDDQVTLATVCDAPDGYPFGLLIAVNYRLEAGSGLTCEFAITNGGETDAPVAAGFHPYFTATNGPIDAQTLTLPFRQSLEMKAFIPTGTILETKGLPHDFLSPREIGATRFNDCFLTPVRDDSGRANVVLESDARAVTVWMDEAFEYVVIYSGDPLPDGVRRRSLAIEPMTCGSDAFNHPEWGLAVLAPDDTLTGQWGVSVQVKG